jgi:hypothetical protein
MDALHYYELKQKYQEYMNRQKKIIKKKKISLEEKKLKIKKLIGKCVKCGKPGGTIFEEKNGIMKAVCGSTTPCNLNINVKRKLYDNMRELDNKNIKILENLKMRIIMTKLDYLFGLVNSKDEIVEKFNTLKNEMAHINEIQLINQKKYGDIISGIHREPLLNDANLELITEIDELKQTYEEYLANPLQSYLTTMVEKYITKIKPLSEKIRDMNYGYYAIEADIEIEDIEKTDNKEKEEENDKKKNKVIYTLVASPYRVDQLEQERK